MCLFQLWSGAAADVGLTDRTSPRQLFLLTIDTTQKTVTISVASTSFFWSVMRQGLKKDGHVKRVLNELLQYKRERLWFYVLGRNEADLEERAALWLFFFTMSLPSAVQEISIFFFKS